MDQRELNFVLFNNWSCLYVDFYEAIEIMDPNFSVLDSSNQCLSVGLFVKSLCRMGECCFEGLVIA